MGGNISKWTYSMQAARYVPFVVIKMPVQKIDP